MQPNYPDCDWCGECECCPRHDCSEPLIKPLTEFDCKLIDKYTRSEKEFAAKEYNKCFGTAPRTDEDSAT